MVKNSQISVKSMTSFQMTTIWTILVRNRSWFPLPAAIPEISSLRRPRRPRNCNGGQIIPEVAAYLPFPIPPDQIIPVFQVMVKSYVPRVPERHLGTKREHRMECNNMEINLWRPLTAVWEVTEVLLIRIQSILKKLLLTLFIQKMISLWFALEVSEKI